MVFEERKFGNAADRVLELGPGAGSAGGHIVFDGTPAKKGGIKKALAKSSYDASDIVAKLVFFAIFIPVLSAAIGVLGIAALQQPLAAFIALIPKIIVAIVLVVIGAACVGFLDDWIKVRNERNLGLTPGTLKLELMIETPQSIVGADGKQPARRLSGGTRDSGTRGTWASVGSSGGRWGLGPSPRA